MPKFFYVARDKHGKKISSFEEGPSQEELVSRLQARDLIVINVTTEHKEGVAEGKPIPKKARFKPRRYHITSNDLVLFCRQLATLLGAGVTIMKSLEVISEQVSSQRFYNVIKDLEKNLEAGLSLHETMAKHPRVFSELWVNLVESGEASGNLALVLSRLANYLERNAEFRRKIISALIYPAILMLAGLGALLFLTVKIIPMFAQLFSGFNLKLPLITQMLIGTSLAVRRYLLVTIGIMTIVFFTLRNYIKTRAGRLRYERFQFRLPIFGEFVRALVLERFSSEMSTLVESGVPILYSLEITEHSVGNLVMAEIIRKIKDDVREGKTLRQPLEQSGFFTPMVVQMVSIGEEVGELSPMFKRINSFYQEYVETFLTRFTALFEPVVVIFMGLVIGMMVIGIFLPIFQLTRIR